MDQARFSELARLCIGRASMIAGQSGGHVEPIHLLLALEQTPECIGHHILSGLGVDPGSLTANFTPRAASPISTATTSDKCEVVYRYALEESDLLHDPQVGTEHLVLGLIRTRDAEVSRQLRDYSISIEKARETVVRTLGPYIPAEHRTLPLSPFTPASRFTAITLEAIGRAGRKAGDPQGAAILADQLFSSALHMRRAIARQVLENAKVDARVLRGQLDELPPAAGISYRDVIQYAKVEAARMHHYHIGTEHLLLGIMHLPQTQTAALLKDRKLTLPEAREQLIAILGPRVDHEPFWNTENKCYE